MLVHKGGKIKNWGGECRDVTPTKSLSQNIRVDVNREVKCFVKIHKTSDFHFLVPERGGGGSQVGCEQRIEIFVKIKKKTQHFLEEGAGGGGGAGSGWGGGGGVRVDVNEELKFL